MLRSKKYLRAFSMIELLIVIAFIAITALVAAPSLSDLIGKNRAESYINELAATLQFVRAAAIRFNEPVKFCASKDQQDCDGVWEKNDSIVKTVITNRILRVLPAVFSQDKLVWRGSIDKKNVIIFSPGGFPSGKRGSFYYCLHGFSKSVLSLVLDATGRVRVSSKAGDKENISCNF